MSWSQQNKKVKKIHSWKMKKKKLVAAASEEKKKKINHNHNNHNTYQVFFFSHQFDILLQGMLVQEYLQLLESSLKNQK